MKQPAAPQPSASVILLDPARGGDEPFGLFLLRRRSQSRFMPNRFVFPGGRVDPRDGGGDPFGDEALRVCALRELWEEAGVILSNDAQAAARLDPGQREAARLRLERGRGDLAGTLEAWGLAPAVRALIPYARWITPEARPQRFDAMFFLALMPIGQQAASDQRETSEGLWIGPSRALAENREGRVELAPPQVRILGELAGFPGLKELLGWAGRNRLSTVRPFLWLGGAERVLLLPWDKDYAGRAPTSPAEACPAGLASRLVHRDGVWLPFLAA